MKSNLKILAIRTDFKHHGEQSGYKQILKYIRPEFTLGINERDPAQKTSLLKKKYQWLFEWSAAKYKKKIDLVHILYAEDYFRWSTRIFKGKPVVATFHQPAELLEKEVTNGSYRGRVGMITHRLTRYRFKELEAAIVTNESQMEVLAKVMPREKIHCIPLGLHLDAYVEQFENAWQPVAAEPTVLTVGNWLRDWDFYFQVVEKCPEWTFLLINRSLPEQYREKLKHYTNIQYLSDVSDHQVREAYMKAHVQFIPVTGLAGSNALVQGLVMGCPLVLTAINADMFRAHTRFVTLYTQHDLSACIAALRNYIGLTLSERSSTSAAARGYAMAFSWENIAEQTMSVYHALVKK